MDYQIIELGEFSVIGIMYELSKSLSNNVKLAQNHWKTFNSKLRNNKLYLGSNWCKYAFIEKIENKVFYYISIPKYIYVKINKEKILYHENATFDGNHDSIKYDKFTVIFKLSGQFYLRNFSVFAKDRNVNFVLDG